MEGHAGVIVDGTFIPFPQLLPGSGPSPTPSATTGRRSKNALVDPFRNLVKVFKQDTLAEEDFCGARALGGPPRAGYAGVDAGWNDEYVICFWDAFCNGSLVLQRRSRRCAGPGVHFQVVPGRHFR